MQPVFEVHDALRADPLNREIAQLTSGGTRKSISIDTPAVQGPTLATDPVTPFRIAGDEYLVVNGSDLFGESGTAAASMRIDLAVDGEQVEGPRLAAVGAGTSPSPTPEESTPPASVDESAPAADEPDSGGRPTWLLVAGLLAVLLVLVAALVLATRRRDGGT